jgi:hypothetical protein
VDEALGMIYRKYDPSYNESKPEHEFDDDTGSLLSYFWSIDACVQNNLCNPETVRNIYCGDYKVYHATYLSIHGEAKTEKQLGTLSSLNTCLDKNLKLWNRRRKS